jgi:hypothetical protein
MDMRFIKEKKYLDVCALGRSYDDQSYPRIEMETLAVGMIVTLIKAGKYALYYAPIHEIELARNTDEAERIEILRLLYGYGRHAGAESKEYAVLEARAEGLSSQGLGLAESFHVANAEAIGASFITCDDALLRKCSRCIVRIWYGTPVDYCKKEGLL